ncbi:MAG: response regulator [Ardenticatenaceae bacterium]
MNNKKGHILVVDDNRMNRIKLARPLQRLGYTVALAVNGQNALECLQAESFDLVLLDIFMPVMDGYQFLEKMKKDPALQNIPVIVISAQEELDTVLKCIEMGATDYLPKRFDPRLLKARVHTSIENKHGGDQQAEHRHLVTTLTKAVAAIEDKTFAPDTLTEMAARTDEWGQLARAIQQMAPKVYKNGLNETACFTQPDYLQPLHDQTTMQVLGRVPTG